jgi:hypothetical protein
VLGDDAGIIGSALVARRLATRAETSSVRHPVESTVLSGATTDGHAPHPT